MAKHAQNHISSDQDSVYMKSNEAASSESSKIKQPLMSAQAASEDVAQQPKQHEQREHDAVEMSKLAVTPAMRLTGTTRLSQTISAVRQLDQANKESVEQHSESKEQQKELKRHQKELKEHHEELKKQVMEMKQQQDDAIDKAVEKAFTEEVAKAVEKAIVAQLPKAVEKAIAAQLPKAVEQAVAKQLPVEIKKFVAEQLPKDV